MRRVRSTAAAIAALVVLVLAATACYPPGQVPVAQSLPPGGRAIANGLVGADMWIEDTNADLSAVVYGQSYYTFPEQYPHNGRFWLYDDDARTTTLLPVRQDWNSGPSSVGVGPDPSWVVFASPDPALQVGPVQMNCVRWHGIFQPMTPIHCSELYRYDLATGQLTQLTGLDGSSPYHHVDPEVSADGLTVDFQYGPAIPEAGMTDKQLDLASGAISDVEVDEPCCTWDRVTHRVTWTGAGLLTSEDVATGEVTILFDGREPRWFLASSSRDGRFVVVGTSASPYRLVDTDERTVRQIPSQWISEDGTRYLLSQRNVAPSGDDRLILAPVQP